MIDRSPHRSPISHIKIYVQRSLHQIDKYAIFRRDSDHGRFFFHRSTAESPE